MLAHCFRMQCPQFIWTCMSNWYPFQLLFVYQVHMINMIKRVHVMCHLPSPHLLLFSSFLGLCIKRNICLQMQRASENLNFILLIFFFLFSISFLFCPPHLVLSLFFFFHIFFILGSWACILYHLGIFAKAYILTHFVLRLPILAAVCFPHSYSPRVNNPIHSLISFYVSYHLENNYAALISSPY